MKTTDLDHKPQIPFDDQISYTMLNSGDFAVYLGRKRVGTITDAPDRTGFLYIPAGISRIEGDVFPTIEAVKRSLEGE